MQNKYEIVLAGSGGQGLVMGGILLAETAMLENKNVAQTQSYGIATRGGFSKSEVIVSEEEIIFQQVVEPNIIVALTEESMKMYEKFLGSTTIIYDSDLVEPRQGNNIFGYPFTKMAMELGNPNVLNMIALGLVSKLTGVVKTSSLEAAITKRFGNKALNIKAMNKGIELVSNNMIKGAIKQ